MVIGQNDYSHSFAKALEDGGLSLFVHHLTGIGVFPRMELLFGSIGRSQRGQPVSEVFRQVPCHFVDGSSRPLSYFNQLREDGAYAQTIPAGETLASQAVKRSFGPLGWPRISFFRHLLQKLLRWRLRLEIPEVIVLATDVVVLDKAR